MGAWDRIIKSSLFRRGIRKFNKVKKGVKISKNQVKNFMRTLLAHNLARKTTNDFVVPASHRMETNNDLKKQNHAAQSSLAVIQVKCSSVEKSFSRD